VTGGWGFVEWDMGSEMIGVHRPGGRERPETGRSLIQGPRGPRGKGNSRVASISLEIVDWRQGAQLGVLKLLLGKPEGWLGPGRWPWGLQVGAWLVYFEDSMAKTC
jgi:hypothetical protein